jgi:hypothetical protein
LKLGKYLLYKCSGLKSKDFKSQEKRERKICKTVGMLAVGGGGQGGRIGRKKERKKERKKIPSNCRVEIN